MFVCVRSCVYSVLKRRSVHLFLHHHTQPTDKVKFINSLSLARLLSAHLYGCTNIRHTRNHIRDALPRSVRGVSCIMFACVVSLDSFSCDTLARFTHGFTL